MRKFLAVLAAVLAGSASTPASAAASGGRAAAGASLTRATMTAALSCPQQTLTVTNTTNVPPRALARTEHAIVDQSLQVRAAWGTPCVRFGPGGWNVLIQYEPSSCGDPTLAALGCHFYDSSGQPFAQASTDPTLPFDVSGSVEMSHEIIEMLMDPGATNWSREICDPFDRNSYTVDGVPLSDWARPAYLGDGSGPPDELAYLADASRDRSGRHGARSAS